jgi:hypothetical protein
VVNSVHVPGHRSGLSLSPGQKEDERRSEGIAYSCQRPDEIAWTYFEYIVFFYPQSGTQVNRKIVWFFCVLRRPMGKKIVLDVNLFADKVRTLDQASQIDKR